MQTYDVTIRWSVNNQSWQNDDRFKKDQSFTTLLLTSKTPQSRVSPVRECYATASDSTEGVHKQEALIDDTRVTRPTW